MQLQKPSTKEAMETFTKLSGAFIASLWMALSGTVQLLLTLIGFDFATGVLVAVYFWRLDPWEAGRGLIRKAMTIIVIGVLHIIAEPMKIGFDASNILAMYFCVTEVISIMRNAKLIGVRTPAWFNNALSKWQTRVEGAAESPSTANGAILPGQKLES